jgi:hypothetical protein
LHGNVLGRTLNVDLNGSKLTLDSPATCATPFELKASMEIDGNTNLARLMDGLPGVNVDPKQISGCIGEDLKKAYQWVATTGSSLGGYSANAANQELTRISNAAAEAARQQAEAAAAAARQQEEAARAEYNRAKDAARNAANQSTNAANNALRDAGNAFKGLGKKKKKHHKGPDPKFAASVFDWDFYYDNAQDVVRAGVDLATHWRDSGFNEGRQGSFEFSARDYLNRYPDLQQFCHGDLQCALQHWLDHGIAEGRQGSPGFNVRSYLARYPDLQNAFGANNYPDALDHWINNGKAEGRNGSP